jgi:ATP-dependent DNA ligase
MLAMDWKKVKNIPYPVYIQPKLDGVRCLMIVDGGIVKFLSRSGKDYTTLDHIAEDIAKYMGGYIDGPTQFILDGEIYSDELSFQGITAAVKKQRPESLKLHFRAYDIVNDELQERRLVNTGNLVQAIASPYVHFVTTIWANDEAQVKSYHDAAVEEGYEGAMLRLPEGKYEQGARSSSLLKVKEFNENEFTLSGFERGQREEDLLAVCTIKGKSFRAKMIGNRKEKQELVEKYAHIHGEIKITIKHFGWTDDGLPRFPIGKAIRDYE